MQKKTTQVYALLHEQRWRNVPITSSTFYLCSRGECKPWPLTWPLALFGQLDDKKHSRRNSPLEQEEVDVIVTLCEEVS